MGFLRRAMRENDSSRVKPFETFLPKKEDGLEIQAALLLRALQKSKVKMLEVGRTFEVLGQKIGNRY